MGTRRCSPVSIRKHTYYTIILVIILVAYDLSEWAEVSVTKMSLICPTESWSASARGRRGPDLPPGAFVAPDGRTSLAAMIPLSVLDLSVVTTGTKPAAALRNSIDLARHADGLGYVRYWLAEHHNLASVASPAPDLMIGQIAAVTKNIRVGSGGVMLPNHAPLVVAERFKMLEALFPGRIDLGLGRAPGTDGATAYALRSRLDRREGDDFLERLHELTLWETRDFPPGHPFNNVVAMPDDTPLPPIWLLGSSDY